MSLPELQNKLIHRILEIDDQDILEYLFSVAGDEHTKPYRLTSFEQQFIRDSLEQYKAGNVISNKEVFDNTAKWLKE